MVRSVDAAFAGERLPSDLSSSYSPWSRHVVLIAHPRYRSLTDYLATQLGQRGIACTVDEPHAGYVPTPTDQTVVVLGEHRRESELRVLERTLATCAEEDRPAIVLIGGRRPIAPSTDVPLAGVVRIGRPPALVFDELLKQLIGPFPSWLRCVTAADLLHAPTGVTWWDDALYVADEHHGHVARIGAAGSVTAIPGLDAPHHIHLDRQRLVIANRSAHELLLVETTADSARPIAALRRVGGSPLRHPNGVSSNEGVTAVADTDNHRVLVSSADPVDEDGDSWQPLEPDGELAYPCGVCVDADFVWVADTHNDRVLGFDHDGALVAELGGHGHRPGTFDRPTGLARWRDLLLVADEQNARLQVLRVRRHRGAVKLVPVQELDRLGHPWIGRPFALSVNLNEQLAVSDRMRRCVWTIDLPSLLGSALR